MHFDVSIASNCNDSDLFCRLIFKIIFSYFLTFPTIPRTLGFSKITQSQKHYKTYVKCSIWMCLRPPKRQNIQFRMGSVDFSAFQDSWPNGSVAGWLILSYFLEEKREICVFRRKYVYSATSRPDLWRGIGFS